MLRNALLLAGACLALLLWRDDDDFDDDHGSPRS
jgi:hypothetical protein